MFVFISDIWVTETSASLHRIYSKPYKNKFILTTLYSAKPSCSERDYGLPAIRAYTDKNPQLFEYVPIQWKKWKSLSGLYSAAFVYTIEIEMLCIFSVGCTQIANISQMCTHWLILYGHINRTNLQNHNWYMIPSRGTYYTSKPTSTEVTMILLGNYSIPQLLLSSFTLQINI